MDSVIKILTIWSPYAPLIPFLVGGLRWRKLTKVHRALWQLVFVAVLTEISAQLIREYSASENNLPLFHVYIVVELALLSRVFALGFEGFLKKENYRLLIEGFTLLALVNLLFFQPLDTFPNNTRTLESLILLGLGLRYFFLVLKELKIFHLEQTFMFWLTTAVLIYFSGNLLLFVYGAYLINPMEVPDSLYFEIWANHGFLNILLYLLYTIALCLPLLPHKSPKYS